jgi:hypothetical protein
MTRQIMRESYHLPKPLQTRKMSAGLDTVALPITLKDIWAKEAQKA